MTDKKRSIEFRLMMLESAVRELQAQVIDLTGMVGKAGTRIEYITQEERLYLFVERNPGCNQHSIARAISHKTVSEIMEMAERLRAQGREIYRVRSTTPGRGRRGFAWFTGDQLRERGLWPVPKELFEWDAK